jgi:tetratricopeptide (TPR) repeat protein
MVDRFSWAAGILLACVASASAGEDESAASGNAELEAGRWEAARGTFAARPDRARKLHGDRDHVDLAAALADYADVLHRLDQGAEALKLAEEALARRRRIFGEAHAATAQAIVLVARCLSDLERYADAVERRGLRCEFPGTSFPTDTPEWRMRCYERDHPDLASAHRAVGVCTDLGGAPAKAIPHYRTSLDMFVRLYSEDHPDVILVRRELGYCPRRAGRDEDALDLFGQDLAARKRLRGEEHEETAEAHGGLRVCLVVVGRLADGRPHLEAQVRILEQLHPEGHAELALALSNLGECLRREEAHGVVPLVPSVRGGAP